LPALYLWLSLTQTSGAADLGSPWAPSPGGSWPLHPQSLPIHPCPTPHPHPHSHPCQSPWHLAPPATPLHPLLFPQSPLLSLPRVHLWTGSACDLGSTLARVACDLGSTLARVACDLGSTLARVTCDLGSTLARALRIWPFPAQRRGGGRGRGQQARPLPFPKLGVPLVSPGTAAGLEALGAMSRGGGSA